MLNKKKRIMCFGDSLTWGWIPTELLLPTERYPFDQRWPGAMSDELGDEYEIIEEGLSARTTDLVDLMDPRLDGSAYLPSALASHNPLDLVIIMLGTNDTKACYNRSPYEISTGVLRLLTQVATSAGGVGTAYPAPQTLLVAPPPLAPITNEWFADMFEGGYEKTTALGKKYKNLADVFGIDFIDASEHIHTDGVDGVHFTAETNIVLGQSIAQKVKEIL